jgi:hypothetical protein
MRGRLVFDHVAPFDNEYQDREERCSRNGFRPYKHHELSARHEFLVGGSIWVLGAHSTSLDPGGWIMPILTRWHNIGESANIVT